MRVLRKSPKPLIWIIAGCVTAQAVGLALRWESGYRFCALNYDDTAKYLMLADSLAAGRGYTPSAEGEQYIPHTHYPPGLPTLLIPGRLLSEGFMVDYLILAVLSLGSILFLGLIASRLLHPVGVLAVLLLTIGNPIFAHLSSVLMTEVPSLFCLSLGLWLLLKGSEAWTSDESTVSGDSGPIPPNAGKRWWRLWLVGGAVVGLGFLVKGTLLVLLPAWLLAYGLSRDLPGRFCRARIFKTGVCMTLGLAPVVAWVVRNQLTPAVGVDGLGHFEETLAGGMHAGPIMSGSRFVEILLTNLKWYIPDRLLDAFAGVAWTRIHLAGRNMPSWFNIAVLLSMLVLTLAAWKRRFAFQLLLWTFLGTAGMMFVRYNGGAPRFWVTAWPVLLILAGASVQRGVNAVPLKKLARSSAAGVMVGMTAVLAFLQWYAFPFPGLPASRNALLEFQGLIVSVPSQPEQLPLLAPLAPAGSIIRECHGLSKSVLNAETTRLGPWPKRFLWVTPTPSGVQATGRCMADLPPAHRVCLMSGQYFKLYLVQCVETGPGLEDANLRAIGGAEASGLTHRPLPAADPTQRRPDIALAGEKLGWEPTTDLARGLAKTIDYFRNLDLNNYNPPTKNTIR